MKQIETLIIEKQIQLNQIEADIESKKSFLSNIGSE